MYVNERWCNAAAVYVKEQICFLEVELLVVSMRLYCLNNSLNVIASAFTPPTPPPRTS